MKVESYPYPRRQERTWIALAGWFFLLGSLLLVVLVTAAQAQTSPLRRPAKKIAPATNQAEIELSKRIAAAQEARKAGNPAAVSLANEHLIALALREMGQLRLLESAYPQAIELYQRSLEMEDRPDSRVDLAIAELQSNHPDDALAETDKVLAIDPNHARALGVQGMALGGKREYAKAAALERASRFTPDIETLYSLGICLLQTKEAKDKQKAATVFHQMVATVGENGSLHVLFGRAYRDADDMQTAIREFQKAVALDTRTLHAHYFLGLARLAVNEWKTTPAIKQEFARELEYYPRDYLANYMLGFIASSERQYDVSDKYLKTAIEVNSDWPEPWLYLGLNAYAQNGMPVAEQMFRKAIERTGNDESRSNFQIRRAYVDLGRILANSGRNQEAEIYIAKARDLQNKVLEQGQQNVAAMALAGGAGNAAAIVPLNKKDESQAAPLLPGSTDPFARVDAGLMERANLNGEQRLAADAQENRLRSILGLSFNDLATSEAMQSKYAEALHHYKEAEKWDKNVSGLAKNLGLAAFRSNNYPEAIQGLSRAIEEKTDDAPLRAMLGMAYFGAEKYSDAARTFSSLGLAGMHDSSVGFAWATSLSRIGDMKQASNVLNEFEKEARANDPLLLAGQLWIEIGDYRRAADTFHRVLMVDASFRKAHYFAGQAYIRWEHWAEAGDEFKEELKLNPDDADAQYNLGFVYLQQSRVEDAIALFEQVINHHPDHANAQYQLGKILLDRGQLSNAVNHLEIAGRLSPQTDYIHYQLQAAYRKASRMADADRELAIYKELKAKQRGRIPSESQNP